MIVAFDFSLKSTGVVALEHGSFKPVFERVIRTSWAGSQWWAPTRYMAFFRDLDALMMEIQNYLLSQSKPPPDLAAEAIVWGKETTPALFALHTRFWEWAWQWRTRMVYLTYQRWRNLLIERYAVEKSVAEVEGKSVAMQLFATEVGHRPKVNDISDAWGVAVAASRFYDYCDDRSLELSVKEKQFFNSSRKHKGVVIKVGLLQERNTNFFDWRVKDVQEV